MLVVQEDGSAVGVWIARLVSLANIRNRRVQLYGSDISVIIKVNDAALDWSSCLILYQALDSDGPTFLVSTFEVCG
jgi:hypothetical protein